MRRATVFWMTVTTGICKRQGHQCVVLGMLLDRSSRYRGKCVSSKSQFLVIYGAKASRDVWQSILKSWSHVSVNFSNQFELYNCRLNVGALLGTIPSMRFPKRNCVFVGRTMIGGKFVGISPPSVIRKIIRTLRAMIWDFRCLHFKLDSQFHLPIFYWLVSQFPHNNPPQIILKCIY